jgi:hypothetical protein
LLENFTMSRFTHRRCLFIPQISLLAQLHRVSVFGTIALGLILNAPALAGSVSATIQTRVRIVSSCRVSVNSLQSPVNTTQGRFNCPTNGASSTSSTAAAYGESANYTVSDAPGTNGAVKILTLNF